MLKKNCSGIILAGGLNKRFGGQNKAFIKIGQKYILDFIFDIFKEFFEEIILVTNEPIKYLDYDLNIVSDILPVQGALNGIYTGLSYASNEYSFIVACDMPFLQHNLIDFIIDQAIQEEKYDIIAPDTTLGQEMLCSVYSKNCLSQFRNFILQDKLKISRVAKSLKVKKISEKILRQKDPDLLSFFNINTPEDLIKANLITNNNL